MASPYTGRVCVGYRAEESWHRDVGQNDSEGDVEHHSCGLPIQVVVCGAAAAVLTALRLGWP